MKIAVDAMGGDNAPEAVVCGAVRAAQNYHEEIILVGQEDKIREVLKAHNAENTPGITILHAPDLVDMHDDPATVLRAKPQSSMAVALNLVKKGEADAIVSAGSTGALLSGATLFCKRIKGVRRGAVAPVMPCKGGQVLLIDAGANTECTPEYLLQFGVMGSLYMQKIKGIANPRVGLVNNGSEDSKGDPLRKEAYALLKAAGEAGHINFVGNVEGRDVPMHCSRRQARPVILTLSATSRVVMYRWARAMSLSATVLRAMSCSRPLRALQSSWQEPSRMSLPQTWAPSSPIWPARRAWMISARCSIRMQVHGRSHQGCLYRKPGHQARLSGLQEGHG